MKIFLIIVVSLFTLTNISAQEDTKVKWFTMEEALKLNEKAPKKFLIDLYTDWCGWCKRMDAETFSHPEIARYINTHFYPVKFNAESPNAIIFRGINFEGSKKVNGRASTHKFVEALFESGNIPPERRGYPSIAYLTEKLELIGADGGYKNPQQLEPLLYYMQEEKFKTVNFSEYGSTFVSKLDNK
ncbi:MAG: DUF255 domain-containing protein [Bacteroidales bacterium]|jgi:thioredoxin-related protein|nr:DUF255 domain-containing protein [Bacteroidales bacterium]